MSQRQAKAARRQAEEYRQFLEDRFEAATPINPKVLLLERILRALLPNRRRRALLIYRLNRERARKVFMDRAMKKISHSIASA